MKNYGKIFSVLMWVLILISVAIVVLGFTNEWASSNVDMVMNYTYLMVGIALFAVIVVGILVSAVNDPKSLLKLLGVVAGIAVVVGGVYAISSGAPAVGITIDQPSATTLKLTDTVLNLTYIAAGLAIVSIVFGELYSAIRNR
ncbi:MAG: hypothetical protein MJY88_07885 [Bacteroidales bacterium]|nr:hypothetical protein [Bacteroidales bacterium]